MSEWSDYARRENYGEVERYLSYAGRAADYENEGTAWREVVVNSVGALAHALIDVADGLRAVAETREKEPVGSGME